MIASAQRVEHYEIAAYGTVRTLARQLGRDEDAELLSKTLSEEVEPAHLAARLRRYQHRNRSPAHPRCRGPDG
jgi:ferritin-like metal-binding protein YciE